MPKIKMTTIGTGARDVEVDRVPNECPQCHHRMTPMFLVAIQPRDGAETLQACFNCTNEECRCLFVAYYVSGGVDSTGLLARAWRCRSVAPIASQRNDFSPEIAALSPRFVEVYNQAMAAESQRLSELVGMGLRKALEFLVKDYLISRAPLDEEKAAIRTQLLGPCIEQRVGNESLKACAQRAVWLGNDETHYERRWEDRDIDDLKRLVRLTVAWVETELLTAEYLMGMPRGRR